MAKHKLHERIINTADEYHLIAEEQWAKLTELEPTDEDTVFEFRRLCRAGLMFYCRAFLMLDMIETDEEQTLEDLLEITCEQLPELEDYIQHNNVINLLDEESSENISKLFAHVEVARTLILERSNKAAAGLFERF